MKRKLSEKLIDKYKSIKNILVIDNSYSYLMTFSLVIDIWDSHDPINIEYKDDQIVVKERFMDRTLPFVKNKITYDFIETKLDKSLILKIKTLEGIEENIIKQLRQFTKYIYESALHRKMIYRNSDKSIVDKKIRWKIFEKSNNVLPSITKKAKYSGFLIESDNMTIDKISDDMIILIPKNMSKDYPNLTYPKIITYDQLENDTNRIIKSMMKYGISNLIVHELHFDQLPKVKHLRSNTQIKNIIIINNMPLSIYLKNTTNQVNLDDMQLYFNLWLGLKDINEKIKWKKAFNNCLLNHLHEIYFKIPYSESNIKRIVPKNNENSLENNISNIIGKITNDVDSYFHHFYGLMFNSIKTKICETCPICCDNAQTFMELSCGHKLCLSCFINSSIHNEICVYCRKSITFEKCKLEQSFIDYVDYFNSFVHNNTLFMTTNIVIYNYLIKNNFKVIHPKFMNHTFDKVDTLIIVGKVTTYLDFIWKIVNKMSNKALYIDI